MNYLIARLKEPSTHAGVAALIACIAAFLPQYAQYILGVAGVFGFTAAAMPDPKN